MKNLIRRMYRARIPMCYAVAAILLGNALGVLLEVPLLSNAGARAAWLVLVLAALALGAVCVLLTFLAPRLLPRVPPRIVRAPVSGRWLGMNSPASRVPSHGVRAYGQAYAIDLVFEPGSADAEPAPRPGFGGRTMRASNEYPAFGRPVLAMIDGTVVRASDRRRDHRARSNLLGYGYLLVEGMLRELGGPGCVVGNHVVIRGDDGVFALVAHLQRGSLAVSVGDRVTTGQRIGRCGNSGNSSEPHVHAQLMDRASLWTAQGLPFAFAGIRVGEDPKPRDGVPENEQHMIAAG